MSTKVYITGITEYIAETMVVILFIALLKFIELKNN